MTDVSFSGKTDKTFRKGLSVVLEFCLSIGLDEAKIVFFDAEILTKKVIEKKIVEGKSGKALAYIIIKVDKSVTKDLSKMPGYYGFDRIEISKSFENEKNVVPDMTIFDNSLSLKRLEKSQFNALLDFLKKKGLKFEQDSNGEDNILPDTSFFTFY